MEGYKLQLAQLRERLSRLTDAYVDGALDKNTHAERRAKLIVEDNELKKRIEDIQAGDDRSLLNLEDYLERVKTASNLHKLTNPLEKRELVKILTSNLRISDENPAITLITEAQIIANRAQVLSGSPHRGIPRTWDTLLKKLLKHFESEDVPIRRAA
jgi:anion-transporting  ArsA/GET3 family ATPase